IWIARLRGIPAIVNYRGGQAEQFLQHQIAWIRPTLKRATVIAVPSAFLERIFARHGFETELLPNVVDLERFVPVARIPGKAHIVITRNLEPIYGMETGLRAFAGVQRAL